MPSPIERLLALPEGKTLEFKRDLSSPRNFLKTLVAFGWSLSKLVSPPETRGPSQGPSHGPSQKKFWRC